MDVKTEKIREEKDVELIEKRICAKCGIVFPVQDRCPRCGSSKHLEVYFELKED